MQADMHKPSHSLRVSLTPSYTVVEERALLCFVAWRTRAGKEQQVRSIGCGANVKKRKNNAGHH